MSGKHETIKYSGDHQGHCLCFRQQGNSQTKCLTEIVRKTDKDYLRDSPTLLSRFTVTFRFNLSKAWQSLFHLVSPSPDLPVLANSHLAPSYLPTCICAGYAGPEKADTVTHPWPGVCKEGRGFGEEGAYISTMILADGGLVQGYWLWVTARLPHPYTSTCGVNYKKNCFCPPPDGEESSLGRCFLAGQVGSNSILYQRHGISITPLFTHL